MQGELADTGANLLSQINNNSFNDPPVPDVGAPRAFSQALTASSAPIQVTNVQEVDVSTELNNFDFPKVGDISDTNQGHMSLSDLDHSDWSTKQVMGVMTSDGGSMGDGAMEYLNTLESDRKDAVSELLNIDKHLQPMTDFAKEIMEQNANSAELNLDTMSESERMSHFEQSMRENTERTVRMNEMALTADTNISAATMRADISIAVFKWAKELATGAVKMVKNIINNTR